MLVGPYRIGVDIGGTFTDLVLVDAKGAVRAFKSPSVPSDPADGVIAAVKLAARTLKIEVQDFLANTELFVHGSTIATNTLLEKKGAKVGLLVTEGFRDSLEIRRSIRENVWDHRKPFPEVLVPRYLRLPVRERMEHDGTPRVSCFFPLTSSEREGLDHFSVPHARWRLDSFQHLSSLADRQVQQKLSWWLPRLWLVR